MKNPYTSKRYESENEMNLFPFLILCLLKLAGVIMNIKSEKKEIGILLGKCIKIHIDFSFILGFNAKAFP